MSESEAPPNKRQRTDDASVIRSDIWHADGSVVLQARLTQFRVHTSVLSMHSPIFKDMFEISRPDSDGPMVDGCPVVELADNPKDVENILRAFYNPTLLLQPQLEFSLVAALIRLGRKYVMEEMWKVGVDILTSEFPNTLAGFDVIIKAQPQSKRIKWTRASRRDCLRLAKETDIQTVLPCLYYLNFLAYKDYSKNGTARLDETSALSCLTELQTFIVATERALRMQFQPGYTLSGLHQMPAGCTNIAICAQERLSILPALAPGVCLLASAPSMSGLGSSPFCVPCQEDLIRQWAVGREKAWEDLPSIFDTKYDVNQIHFNDWTAECFIGWLLAAIQTCTHAPPAKRARTDDASSPTTTTRSNICFVSIRSIPQPDTPQPLVEGCPVVELHDDPQDVETILRVIYNPAFFLRRGVLGHVDQCLFKFAHMASLDPGSLLQAEIPTTLDGSDDLGRAPYEPTLMEDYPGLYLDILTLLQEHHILWLLPAAYYLRH
ncbi:BTB domain-containing protein [Mycena indigotica]|uniref:BTB domain-containing protein n=1 Tax=Mycena indigotica TaxID=2126181 RepID=A0A8H6TE87_9AGAR|nr:BTB domain-containing protein [Mycena indigotica]KAF7315142.1 BTB domain-containing protein [Mycena indigotica]